MKNVLFLFLLFVLGSCSNKNNTEIKERAEIKESNNAFEFKYEISKYLIKCVPENWTVWEEHTEENKTYLAHIGRGIFDLHFRANYELEDTLLDENYNGKKGNKYCPEIVLHFYRNEEIVKEEVKFTRENAEIISDIKFALDFGKTDKYLVYECLNEKQIFLPEDVIMLELRECLIEKITTYNKMYIA
jgi:hypothetical protein